MSRQRRHTSARAVLAVLVLTLTCAVAGCARSGAAAAPTPSRAGMLRVVVVGDSLSSGYATPGDPWTVPAQRLFRARHLPVHLVNAARPGTGYVAVGTTGVTFADLASQAVTSGTAIVVVFGSDNDHPGPALDSATLSTLRLVRRLAPDADIVAVGPPATPAQNGRSLAGSIVPLQHAAFAVGATFVDASDWFSGDRAERYLSADQEHPNDAGEDYLARRFVALLTPVIRTALHGTAATG